MITFYVWIVHTLIAWKKHHIYLLKPQEWCAECTGIFKILKRKFSKNSSKKAARSNKIESSALETKSKIFRSKVCYRDDPEYNHCKEVLDK